MKYFRKIKSKVEVQPLLQEIEEIPGVWDRDTRRQSKIKVQRESQNIALRGPVRSSNDQRKLRDVHESRYTTMASKFPRTVAFLKDFAREQNAELSRARLVRLVPGHRVHPHVDGGDYYLVRNRYHLVLHSSSGSSLKAGDEEVRMRPGELWWFDNKARHEAFNDGDVERIHLIFDLLPASALQELFGENFVPNDVDADRLTPNEGAKAPTTMKSKSTKTKGEKSSGAKHRKSADQSAEEPIGRRTANIVIEQLSGELLINDRAAVLFHPAGLCKLMVIHEMFEALRRGDLSLESQISVSRENDQLQNSVFQSGDGITVKTAIQALVQRRANDVALSRAINLFGDEQKYVEYLTTRAKALGMSATRLANVTGRHHPDQVSTPMEMMKLFHILIRDFPERFAFFGETSFSLQDRTYKNLNPLLGTCDGVDGVFSARNPVSGHHVVVTAKRDGRRLVALVAGAKNSKDAASRASDLLGKPFEKRPPVRVAELVTG